MKSTKQKLTLAQETLRLLTNEQPGVPQNVGTTLPICPTCSLALQTKAGAR